MGMATRRPSARTTRSRSLHPRAVRTDACRLARQPLARTRGPRLEPLRAFHSGFKLTHVVVLEVGPPCAHPHRTYRTRPSRTCSSRTRSSRTRHIMSGVTRHGPTTGQSYSNADPRRPFPELLVVYALDCGLSAGVASATSLELDDALGERRIQFSSVARRSGGGGLFGLGFSLALLLDEYAGIESRLVLGSLIFIPLALLPAAAIYDFRLHRRRTRPRTARYVPAALRLPVVTMALPELYAALRSGGSDDSRVEAELRRRAAREPEAFASFLRTVEFDEDCGLQEVYLTLADEAKSHVGLLLAELDRLFLVAEQHPHNRWVFDQIMAFEFIEGHGALGRGIVAAIRKALQSPVTQVRRCAAALAAGFLPESTSELASRLRAVHSGDADWRVRALAYSSLSQAQASDETLELPERSFGDRVRWLFVGASVRDFSA